MKTKILNSLKHKPKDSIRLSEELNATRGEIIHELRGLLAEGKIKEAVTTFYQIKKEQNGEKISRT